MCHPAVILLSSQVSLLPSQEIKGVTVWFQLGSSPQSSLCPFPRVAGGVQMCVCREGRVPCLGWMHRQQLGSAELRAHPGQLCQGWAYPGLCCSCRSLPRAFTPSQLTQPAARTQLWVPPRGNFPVFHLGNNKNETGRFHSPQCGGFGGDRNDCSSALLNAHCHSGRDAVAAKFGVD